LALGDWLARQGNEKATKPIEELRAGSLNVLKVALLNG
jgi:hypothetical protein